MEVTCGSGSWPYSPNLTVLCNSPCSDAEAPTRQLLYPTGQFTLVGPLSLVNLRPFAGIQEAPLASPPMASLLTPSVAAL